MGTAGFNASGAKSRTLFRCESRMTDILCRRIRAITITSGWL